MKTTLRFLAVVVAAAFAALGVAQVASPSSNGSGHVALKEADLQWSDAPPALPAGVKIAVLQGDPAAAGMFTVRLKMPAGYKIPLHTHPTDEVVTVLSGSVDFTMGGASAASQNMSAGSFIFLPAGMQHAASSSGEAILQVTSQGPFVINYVNPSDDPRNKK